MPTPGNSASPAASNADPARDRLARHEDEIDWLIAELRARGVAYLTGGHGPDVEAEAKRHPLPPAELLRRLAMCQEPSVRDATIALLLLHPELAEHLPPAHATTDDGTLQQLATLGLAAAYLQRQWRSRLTLALGPKPVLSINYWRAWELPDPDGPPPEYGLCRLAAHERQRRG